jgi:SAM-dependent methyltransferase
MPAQDSLCEIARYYDGIMHHVDYDRWYTVTTALAALLPENFVHLDAACGTGTLIKSLRRDGWKSVGVDLSFAMLRAGAGGAINRTLPVAAGDLRALPLAAGVDFATCLFDSINFLLETEDLARAFLEVAGALRPEGVFYFDVVTELMVTQHFEGQEWTENNGRFTTTWSSTYSRKTGIAETHVRVGSGPKGIILERVFTQREIERALDEAGLTVLGAYDAHTWRSPGRRTIRIDYVAAKSVPRAMKKRFRSIRADLRARLPLL